MAQLIYGLCALTAMACAILLFNGHRRNKSSMLWWSGLCFLLLALSNGVVCVEYFTTGEAGLWPLRHALSLAAVSALLYGLIFEEH